LDQEDYYTLCISSQCGCAVDCKFCLTGVVGFKRNLTVAEIVKQVVYCFSIGYPIKNIVFMGMGEPLMNYENDTLNIHLKINFNDNKISKNISYELKNISDKLELNLIIKDLKLKIADVWKQQNLVNLLMPLSIQLKFAHKDIENLDKARNVFSRINIIENYSLEEFNINNSIFKIYYYGNPKKLRSELSKFGYMLMNNQGVWHLILNE